jgi:hypothetical protein
MKLNYSAFLLTSCFLLFLSCQKDGENNSKDDIIVNDSWAAIISPGSTSTTAPAANVGLLIVYSTSAGKLVQVRAKVFPKSNRDNVVFDFNKKVNDVSYTLSQSINLSNFPLGTVFTIIAETDHNKSGTEVAKDSVDFSIR